MENNREHGTKRNGCGFMIVGIIICAIFSPPIIKSEVSCRSPYWHLRTTPATIQEDILTLEKTNTDSYMDFSGEFCSTWRYRHVKQTIADHPDVIQQGIDENQFDEDVLWEIGRLSQ